MPAWVWVLIAIAVVAILAVVVWQALMRRQTGRLQEQFGPEYERTLGKADSKRDAEAELQAREERRQQIDVRPLSRAARDRYLQSWQEVQSQFVDDPRAAVASADSLIQSVMSDRGYPVEDFDQRASDLSVDHPEVISNYRAAHGISVANERGKASTEDLRTAMVHYRALFDDLLERAPEQEPAEASQA